MSKTEIPYKQKCLGNAVCTYCQSYKLYLVGNPRNRDSGQLLGELYHSICGDCGKSTMVPKYAEMES